jgi:hypothetical protein
MGTPSPFHQEFSANPYPPPPHKKKHSPPLEGAQCVKWAQLVERGYFRTNQDS